MFSFSFRVFKSYLIRNQVGLNTLGVVVLVSVVNQWLLLPVLVLGIAFVQLRQIYLATSRSIKRLENTSINLAVNIEHSS